MGIEETYIKSQLDRFAVCGFPLHDQSIQARKCFSDMIDNLQGKV